MKQKTIKNNVSTFGVGLHTGSKVNITFLPSDVNTGIVFVRIDSPCKTSIEANILNVVHNQNLPRCTSIGKNNLVINTIEHLMSALSGLGISNLIIEIDGDEVPGLDGSSVEFVRLLKSAQIVEQSEDVKCFFLNESVGVQSKESSIFIFPSDKLKVSYLLDYDNDLLRSQFFQAEINEETFNKNIAPCRTFCLESEAQALQAKGLGKGANYDNTLVVGQGKVINNKPLFDDEFARHKMLDLIGDLYLLGSPLIGHVFAVKSGHDLNIELVKKIYKQKKKVEEKSIVQKINISSDKEIRISDIMKILPHRYPFLLVDKVYEIEEGKKAVGIKNVTINDGFFQGHFPTKAVMPGVLMIEAMAQTAGVAILSKKSNLGKVAFFMSVDKVKFRKVVQPGDQLVMEIEVIKDRAKFAQVSGVSKVDGEVVVEADMMFSYTDASYLN